MQKKMAYQELSSLPNRPSERSVLVHKGTSEPRLRDNLEWASNVGGGIQGPPGEPGQPGPPGAASTMPGPPGPAPDTSDFVTKATTDQQTIASFLLCDQPSFAQAPTNTLITKEYSDFADVLVLGSVDTLYLKKSDPVLTTAADGSGGGPQLAAEAAVDGTKSDFTLEQTTRRIMDAGATEARYIRKTPTQEQEVQSFIKISDTSKQIPTEDGHLATKKYVDAAMPLVSTANDKLFLGRPVTAASFELGNSHRALIEGTIGTTDGDSTVELKTNNLILGDLSTVINAASGQVMRDHGTGFLYQGTKTPIPNDYINLSTYSDGLLRIYQTGNKPNYDHQILPEMGGQSGFLKADMTWSTPSLVDLSDVTASSIPQNGVAYGGTNGLEFTSSQLQISGGGITTGQINPSQHEVTNLGDSTHRFASLHCKSLNNGTALQLPTVDGTAGQVLSTDGSGNLSWVTSGGGAYAYSITKSDLSQPNSAGLTVANQNTSFVYTFTTPPPHENYGISVQHENLSSIGIVETDLNVYVTNKSTTGFTLKFGMGDNSNATDDPLYLPDHAVMIYGFGGGGGSGGGGGTLSLSDSGTLALSGSNSVSIDTDKLAWKVYSTTADLPAASANHGMIAHVHSEGAMYFAHNNAWVKLGPISTSDVAGLQASLDDKLSTTVNTLGGGTALHIVSGTQLGVKSLAQGSNITLGESNGLITISSTSVEIADDDILSDKVWSSNKTNTMIFSAMNQKLSTTVNTLGTGQPIHSVSGNQLAFKTLAGGSNVSITENNGVLSIHATAGGSSVVISDSEILSDRVWSSNKTNQAINTAVLGTLTNCLASGNDLVFERQGEPSFTVGLPQQALQNVTGGSYTNGTLTLTQNNSANATITMALREMPVVSSGDRGKVFFVGENSSYQVGSKDTYGFAADPNTATLTTTHHYTQSLSPYSYQSTSATHNLLPALVAGKLLRVNGAGTAVEWGDGPPTPSNQQGQLLFVGDSNTWQIGSKDTYSLTTDSNTASVTFQQYYTHSSAPYSYTSTSSTSSLLPSLVAGKVLTVNGAGTAVEWGDGLPSTSPGFLYTHANGTKEWKFPAQTTTSTTSNTYSCNYINDLIPAHSSASDQGKVMIVGDNDSLVWTNPHLWSFSSSSKGELDVTHWYTQTTSPYAASSTTNTYNILPPIDITLQNRVLKTNHAGDALEWGYQNKLHPTPGFTWPEFALHGSNTGAGENVAQINSYSSNTLKTSLAFAVGSDTSTGAFGISNYVNGGPPASHDFAVNGTGTWVKQLYLDNKQVNNPVASDDKSFLMYDQPAGRFVWAQLQSDATNIATLNAGVLSFPHIHFTGGDVVVGETATDYAAVGRTTAVGAGALWNGGNCSDTTALGWQCGNSATNNRYSTFLGAQVCKYRRQEHTTAVGRYSGTLQYADSANSASYSHNTYLGSAAGTGHKTGSHCLFLGAGVSEEHADDRLLIGAGSDHIIRGTFGTPSTSEVELNSETIKVPAGIKTQADLASLAVGTLYVDTSAGNVLKVKL